MLVVNEIIFFTNNLPEKFNGVKFVHDHQHGRHDVICEPAILCPMHLHTVT